MFIGGGRIGLDSSNGMKCSEHQNQEEAVVVIQSAQDC